ncbi:hypothetical protein MF406_08395 [Georgenia sp. TF02-10]|uniref:hypothetical protein n=1 Tax=Georgenia sp. TF02-10 TaxID=2917725 RepID=UPI001FA7CF49|nr:hypothetical protein [Georgenia sp. TF02-10]UNX56199.1 hypothetical protein MF406_08395 [Georgenia sp. TF02-10]
MLIELATQSHGVDCHGLTVVVDNDHLNEPASPVGADVQVAVALADHTDGVTYCVLDVEIRDAVLARVVGDSAQAGYLASGVPREDRVTEP